MSARKAGMKKNNARMPSCGTSSRQARLVFSKCDCLSPCSSSRPLAVVRSRPARGARSGSVPRSSAAASLAAGIHLLELPKNFVSARRGVVHGLLDRLLAEEAGQDLVLDRDVCLGAVAEPETA